MKRFKMDKWGQLPMFSEPTDSRGPWTVRSVFLLAMSIVLALVFIYSFIKGMA